MVAKFTADYFSKDGIYESQFIPGSTLESPLMAELYPLFLQPGLTSEIILSSTTKPNTVETMFSSSMS
jgi:hypothetical protein